VVRTTDLSSGWEFAQAEWLGEPPFGYTRVPGWLPAEVPGHAHLDLVANGIIRHPFEEMAELGCQWVDDCDWCYRTRFSWAPDAENPRRVLHFEGLDTVCTILLNGEEIGRHDNMLLPLEIDVTEKLMEGENELRIDFQSAVRVGRERRRAYFEKHGLAEDTANFDERAFVRKAQYMFGWDWGPRLVSCGIWKPVRLIETLGVEVTGTAGVPAGDAAKPQIQLRREPDQFGESFEFVVNGKPIWAMGANWIPIHSFPSVQFQTNGEGEVSRTLHLQVRESSLGQESLGGSVAGLSRTWWCKALRDLLESCKAMNFNMIRVWGGGLYESDEFYELCDELGILVWQDFPFACSYYPDDEDFVEKIREEATYHVKRLSRFACLALWCGNNENLTMWEGKWGGADRNPARFHGERIWNEVLKHVVEEHDPGRAYIPTSPIGSAPGKEDCNAGGFGDSHYWDVWHGRGDWVHYSDSTARFSSEFGFPSACGHKAWAQVFSADLEAGDVQLVPEPPTPYSLPLPAHPDLRFPFGGVCVKHRRKMEGRSPSSPSVRWHDKTGRPWEYLRELITKHYPEPKDLDELIYFSQLNQRDAMRHAIEHYRRSEFCRGTLIWQLNDVWPTLSWSLLDSEGEWKAAALELQRLYAPMLASFEVGANTVRLWGINDSDHEQAIGLALVGVFDSMTGTPHQMKTLDQSSVLFPGDRRVLLELDTEDLDPKRSILWTNLANSNHCRLICEPKDLRLTQPKIQARLVGLDIVEVVADVPVVDLFLWDPTGGAEFRVYGKHDLSGNFQTFSMSIPWPFVYSGTVGELMGRSLAGVHEIELLD
jgi:beta-mannosidase